MTDAAPKYLQRCIDRHGKQRVYFRRPGWRRVSLPPLSSPQFLAAYEKAQSSGPESVPTPRRVLRLERFRRVVEAAMQRAAARSKERDRVCTITTEWVMARIAAQRLRCALTGIPFADRQRGSAWLTNPYAPSIDRIDCSRGYEEGNVRVVLTAVNFALNEWGEDVFFEIAKGFIAKRPKRRRPVLRSPIGGAT